MDTWPVLATYDVDHLARISLPVGGVGTGTIGLGGRGDLRDFEVGNRPARGWRPEVALRAVRLAPAGAEPTTLVMEGPVPPEQYEGPFGSPAPAAGLPRFAEATFRTCYPFGRVDLADPRVPARVSVGAFNPLVPGDLDASSLPVAVLRHRVVNTGETPMTVSVCLAMSNFVGSDGTNDRTGGNRNTVVRGEGAVGVVMTAPDLDPTAEAAGAVALVTPTGPDRSITTRTDWAQGEWDEGLRDFWQDLSDDGALSDDAAVGEDLSSGPVADGGPEEPIVNRAGWAALAQEGAVWEEQGEVPTLHVGGDDGPGQGNASVGEGQAQGDVSAGWQEEGDAPAGWQDRTDGGDRVRGRGRDQAVWEDLVVEALSGPAPSRPVACLCVQTLLPPGGRADVDIVLAWNFPGRRAWHCPPAGDRSPAPPPEARPVVGNHYSRVHPDPFLTACRVLEDLGDLEGRSVEAASALADSDVPAPILQAAVANLSTLRSQTLQRTADGRFWGWEGIGDREGSCCGTCTHVWGYEFATNAWFPEISWSLRETQFAHATDERGLMSFRVGQPIEAARTWGAAAADGQMACLVHLYADWRSTGDTERLRALWPHARRALAFAWTPGGWDSDTDGVMEGVQHNTMDVEYYGPNPQMTTWYLAALRACAHMADHLGEEDFARRCADLAARGAAWTEQNLFTGEYYRQLVRPVPDGEAVAEGLRVPGADSRDPGPRPDGGPAVPDRQLGDGCLIDQLVGEHVAVLTGLGPALDPGRVRTTLRTVVRCNTVRAGDVANHARAFLLGGERGVLMATWPHGPRPHRPFPYFTEVMTGFEHTLALGLVQAGLRQEATAVVADVRHRYDGARRNPFDEAECGRHYARALAAWSTYVAWTGFDHDQVTGTLRMHAPAPGASVFWTTGGAWGTARGTADGVRLRVAAGSLKLRVVELDGHPVPVDGADAAAGFEILVTRPA